jgi:hypothetical protein
MAADGESAASNSTCSCSICARLAANERKDLEGGEDSQGVGAQSGSDDKIGKYGYGLDETPPPMPPEEDFGFGVTVPPKEKNDFGFDAPIRTEVKSPFRFKFGVTSKEEHGFGLDPRLLLPPNGTEKCGGMGDRAGAGTLDDRTETFIVVLVTLDY